MKVCDCYYWAADNLQALLLLEYLVKGGSEDVAKFALERIYAINTLKVGG